MEKEELKEVGKQILNIGVAVIVFAIIQPLMKNELNVDVLVIALFVYIALTLFGAFLIRKGR